jgi:hypothetical protein
VDAIDGLTEHRPWALPAPDMNEAIAEQRLRRQLLTRAGLRRPADVVSWFGAIQAQEYEAAKWAIGLRLQDGAVAADVDRAFQDGEILRTHVLRPTWHFVAPSDIRWMLALTAPRVHRRMAPYHVHLELDGRIFARALRVIERAFAADPCLTRAELAERLRRARLPMAGPRLAHVVMHAELEALICSGPRRGRQFTYALMAERAANAAPLSRDEALATLARRFWRSHGPATMRDFVWWSGLATADGKRAVEMIKAVREEIDGRTYWTVAEEARGTRRDVLAHLLPIYDEYLVAYKDREAVPHGPRVAAEATPFVTFQNVWTIAGQVAGTWRAARGPRGVAVDAVPVRRVTRQERAALDQAVRRYESFLETPVQLAVT